MPLVAREPSLSSSSFMGARPRICGKMIARWSMRSRGEGGKQGELVMPALYALGQHRALVAVQAILLPAQEIFAFLDDIWVVANPWHRGSLRRVGKRFVGHFAPTWAKRSCSAGEVSCRLVANTSSKRAGR